MQRLRRSPDNFYKAHGDLRCSFPQAQAREQRWLGEFHKPGRDEQSVTATLQELATRLAISKHPCGRLRAQKDKISGQTDQAHAQDRSDSGAAALLKGEVEPKETKIVSPRGDATLKNNNYLTWDRPATRPTQEWNKGRFDATTSGGNR